jgi:hypothetical protein
MADKPSVLFVCVHNAGRSQMAAGWLTQLSEGAIEVRSAGSVPAEQVNPVAVEAMREVGVDIAAERPKILTDTAVRDADVVVTMGCGDASATRTGSSPTRPASPSRWSGRYATTSAAGSRSSSLNCCRLAESRTGRPALAGRSCERCVVE